MLSASVLLGVQFWPAAAASYVPQRLWYYDIQSGGLETNPVADSPAGHVFSCGRCDNPSERWPGYLVADIEGRDMIAAPEADPQWVDAESLEGAQLYEATRDRCGANGRLTECYPG